SGKSANPIPHFASTFAHRASALALCASAGLKRAVARVANEGGSLMPTTALPIDAARFKVDHAHDHRAPRIERQILESPLAVECAHVVVDRMGDNAEAAHVARSFERRAEGEEEQRSRIALSLMILVNGKLAEQRRRQRVGSVALLRLGQESPLDLRGAQGDV